MNRLMRTPGFMLVALAFSTGAALAQEWTFTDDVGNAIALDSQPERVVAFSASAAGLMQFGIRPVAIFTDESASEKSYAEFDLEGIEVIRTAYNELQPESLLAFEPDLIVTEFFPTTGDYSGGDQMTPEGQFGGVAPIVGIEQGDSVLSIIESYGQLAEALGADLEAPEIAEQREAFETAREAFTAAAEAKPDLVAMAAYASADGFYVARPGSAAELQDFQRWGLEIVMPDVPEGEYWHQLSWENADTYPADILLLDDRFDGGSRIAVDSQPLARLIPAVGADQMGDWPAWWIRTYSAYAGELDKITALIERSEDVTE